MARVNLDGKVWKDPRVKRLAKRRQWSLRETIGTLAAVWDVAYDNKTPIMPRVDVDTAAESDEFASDMIAEDLATAIGDDLVSVRLRGVEERIQYLLSQAERGRLGGLARAARAERGEDGRLQPNAKQAPSERQAFAKHPPALPLAPDLPLPLPPAQPLERVSGKPDAPALVDPIAELADTAVREINRLAGTSYRPDSKAIRKDCKSLHAAGHTPEDVTRVVEHKRAWLTDERMREHFRPGTLLRPSNFARYVDDARAKPAGHGHRVIPMLGRPIVVGPPADADDEPSFAHLGMQPPSVDVHVDDYEDEAS